MSVFVWAALAMATASPATSAPVNSQDRADIVQAARRMQVSSSALYAALSAPQKPRRNLNEARYCLPLNEVIRDRRGMVCRTRHEWSAFGLEVNHPRG